MGDLSETQLSIMEANGGRTVLTNEDKQWMLEQLERDRQSTLERLERVETSLLTEFHKWASTVETRVKSHSAEGTA